MNHRFSPKGAQAQDQSSECTIIPFARQQRGWIAAFLPVALRDKYAPSTIATATVLIELHLNRKTGQLNPGIARLAADLQVSTRTVRRALNELEAGGWINRHKRTHHATDDITLHIPERTTDVPSQPDTRTVRGDTEAVLEGTQNALRGDICCPPREHLNTDTSLRSVSINTSASLRSAGASAPRPARSEGHGLVTFAEAIAVLAKRTGATKDIVTKVVCSEINDGTLVMFDKERGLFRIDDLLR